MNVSIFTDEIMSETALLNLYAPHYMLPFASFIISTRTHMGPSFEQLADDALPARDTGLLLSSLVNPLRVL
jgi:hypothetical protein